MTCSASRRVPRVGAVVVLTLAALTVGCGSGGGAGTSYPSAKLSGTVAVDGQPIATGSMQFLPPPETKAPVVTAEIKDGRYAAAGVPTGKVRVIFTAVKETGRVDTKSTSTPVPEVVNLIPDRYRDGIDITVTADKADQNFDLKSK
jgi:hypothetical protein